MPRKTSLRVYVAPGPGPVSTPGRDFPIEVRRHDKALVARSLTGQSVDVGPGTYEVLTRLPGGAELWNRVEIEAGQVDAEVELVGRPGEVSPPGSRAEALAVRELATSIALLSGNPFEGRPLRAIAGTWGVDAEGWWFLPRVGDSRPFAVMWADPAGAGLPTLWFVPGSARDHVYFRAPAGPASVPSPRLVHPQADLVLSYLEQGALAEADLSGRSDLLTFQRILEDKRWDPIAGALGAYMLLRHGEASDALDRRSRRLLEFNPSLPDATCIRAEVLARRREHEEAFDLLLTLPRRGVPFYTDGLAIAGRRLDHYLRVSLADVPWLAEDRRAEARRLLRRLDWLGMHCVPGAPILTLSGFDPADPDEYAAFWDEAVEVPASR